MHRHVDELIHRYPTLATCHTSIIESFEMMKECYSNGGKVLVAGNGGSAADAEHISGELMKKFRISRPISKTLSEKLKSVDAVLGAELATKVEYGLMTIPLVSHDALMTAYINDVDSRGVYAQQVLGYGKKGDVFLGISTSGNSLNIVNAAIMAKALDMTVIGLTGETGGAMLNYSDVIIRVPETETYKIQELHLPIYHCLSMMLEDYFFGEA